MKNNNETLQNLSSSQMRIIPRFVLLHTMNSALLKEKTAEGRERPERGARFPFAVRKTFALPRNFSNDILREHIAVVNSSFTAEFMNRCMRMLRLSLRIFTHHLTNGANEWERGNRAQSTYITGNLRVCSRGSALDQNYLGYLGYLGALPYGAT